MYPLPKYLFPLSLGETYCPGQPVSLQAYSSLAFSPSDSQRICAKNMASSRFVKMDPFDVACVESALYWAVDGDG